MVDKPQERPSSGDPPPAPVKAAGDTAAPPQSDVRAARKAERAQRLSAELRANLRRRKAQERAREQGTAKERGIDSPASQSAKPIGAN